MKKVEKFEPKRKHKDDFEQKRKRSSDKNEH